MGFLRKENTITNILRIIKYYVYLILYNSYVLLKRITKNKIHVINSEESVKEIISNHLSVSRFGDGEFLWIQRKREPGNFEKNSTRLSSALREVLQSSKKNMAICIPDIFDGLDDFTKDEKYFWAMTVIRNRKTWDELLDRKIVYFDSLFTRPYNRVKDKRSTDKKFKLLKQIWDNRDVILVEGHDTRFGVGNDLLGNTASVCRILAPSKNAFEKYDKIHEKVLAALKVGKFQDPVVLVALGPTATVLCYDLSDVCQAIDIGHLDIEYSWYLLNAKHKVDISFKYVNEVLGGSKTSKIPDLNDRIKYQREVICEIN